MDNEARKLAASIQISHGVYIGPVTHQNGMRLQTGMRGVFGVIPAPVGPFANCVGFYPHFYGRIESPFVLQAQEAARFIDPSPVTVDDFREYYSEALAKHAWATDRIAMQPVPLQLQDDPEAEHYVLYEFEAKRTLRNGIEVVVRRHWTTVGFMYLPKFRYADVVAS